MALTKLDRCDRCGAAAVHRFERKGEPGVDLLFCQHHTTKFLEVLHKQGFVTVESEDLVAA